MALSCFGVGYLGRGALLGEAHIESWGFFDGYLCLDDILLGC